MLSTLYFANLFVLFLAIPSGRLLLEASGSKDDQSVVDHPTLPSNKMSPKDSKVGLPPKSDETSSYGSESLDTTSLQHGDQTSLTPEQIIIEHHRDVFLLQFNSLFSTFKKNAEKAGTRYSDAELIPLAERLFLKQIASRDDIFSLFTFEKRLGSGGFGDVWEVKICTEVKKHFLNHDPFKSAYALKLCKIGAGKNATKNGNTKQAFEREARIMMKFIEERHIVQLFSWGTFKFNKDNLFFFLMEKIEGRDLFDEIMAVHSDPKFMTKDYLLMITAQLVSIYRTVQAKKILFRDYKPENFLVKKNGQVVLVDFGLSTECKFSTLSCGSLEYVSPELLTAKKYSNGPDVWAIGVTLYAFATGQSPFVGNTKGETVHIIKNATKKTIGKVRKNLKGILKSKFAEASKHSKVDEKNKDTEEFCSDFCEFVGELLAPNHDERCEFMEGGYEHAKLFNSLRLSWEDIRTCNVRDFCSNGLIPSSSPEVPSEKESKKKSED